MPNRLTVPALLAYGLASVFTVVGLVVLAGGDVNVDANRTIRNSIAVAGDERHVFGALLLATGYVLWRWIFQRPVAERRVVAEVPIIALFAVLGYVAYRIGG